MEASFDRVWSRVITGGDDGLTELRRGIRRETEIRGLCGSQLKRNVGPAARETLNTLGKHASDRLRQLQALHCLIEGGVWKPPVSNAEPVELPQALRELYRLLSDGASAAGDADARIGPDASALLRRLAEASQADAALLRRLAARSL